MSASNSDSDGSWTVVQPENNADRDSSAGSDYVAVQDVDTVSYHHKEKVMDGGDEDADLAAAGYEDDVDECNEEDAVGVSLSSWDNGWFWDDTCVSVAPDATMSASTSSIEEVSIVAEKSPVLSESLMSNEDSTPAHHCCPALLTLDSESEHSDFVRLEPPLPEEMAASVDPLHSSGSSSASSSISANFRFVQAINPVIAQQQRHRFYMHRDDDNDADAETDSLPPDVDDRCESDISGIAPDESDLSVSSLGDTPLTAGNRSYRHRPNPSLNSVLTTLTLMALASAVGIGFGHYFGFQRESILRKQQEFKMKEVQDDFLMCLKQRDQFYNQINAPDFPEAKLNAITAVWKQKYQELIVEKVELEQLNNEQEVQLQQNIDLSLVELQSHKEEMHELHQELSRLKVQYSTNLVQAEEKQLRMDVLLNEIEARKDDGRKQIRDQDEQIEVQKQQLETKNKQLEAEQQRRERQLEDQVNQLNSLEQQLAVKDEQLKQLSQSLQPTDDTKPCLSKLQQATERPADSSLSVTKTSALSEVTALKTELNLVRHENQELMMQVSRLRYQMPAAQLMTNRVADGSANNVVQSGQVGGVKNDDASEATKQTESLKHAGSQQKPINFANNKPNLLQTITRPSQKPGEPPEAEITEEAAQSRHATLEVLQKKVVELNERLTKERGRSEMWLSLYMSQKEHKATSPADFFTCLTFILPTVNMTELNLYMHQLPDNVSRSFYQNWQFVERLVSDTAFADLIREKWSAFSQHATNSSSSNKLPKRAKKIYKDIKKSIERKWDEFKQSVRKDTEHVHSVINNEKFQSIVNRTKETVSQLSEKIHSTWHRVKNLSADILSSKEAVHLVKDSVVNKASDIRHKMSSIGNKVSENFDKIRQAVNNGWIRKKTADRASTTYENHPQDHLSNGPISATDDKQREGFATDALPRQAFTNKADHKQTQASILEQKYEEFWKRANFDPDDYVHEDFFEGNQREYKKQQKRFRKLYGRILQLNEDMFYSMDDDDVEDMWEDIDDLQDDIELDVQPEKLKMWLMCQIRWWKSRFQRKHRSEDFIKGCGAQLMRWQLRAQCKPLCKGKKCKHVVSSPVACQYLYTQTVIIADQVTAKSKQCSQNTDSSADMHMTTNDTVLSNAHIENDPTSWYFNHAKLEPAKDRIDESVDDKEELAWVFDADTKWLFTRAIERENHRENPDWLFRRANKRQFEREKPWYYKRADDRNQRHAEREAKDYA